MEQTLVLHVCGILAIIGSLLYAIGDLLLLAPAVGATRQSGKLVLDTDAVPQLRRRVFLFNVLNQLGARRLVWGALVGVFATPLVLVGMWLMYQGLQPAGAWLALPPVLLFGYAMIIGAYVHGSFYHLGETVHALAAVDQSDRLHLLHALARQQKSVTVVYTVLLVCFLIASAWLAISIGFGTTLFPRWMAFVNPVTLTLLWFGLRRLLPKRVHEVTQGAGFNIASIAFFVLATVTLW